MKNYNFINGVDISGNDVELDWKSNYEEDKLRSSDYLLLSQKLYLEDTVEHVVKMNPSVFFEQLFRGLFENLSKEDDITKALVNVAHPVGSVILTTDASFDPSKSYPGTNWVKWTDGYLKVDETPNSTASGDYSITEEMLPAHHHQFTLPERSLTTKDAGEHTHAILAEYNDNYDSYKYALQVYGGNTASKGSYTYTTTGGVQYMKSDGYHMHVIWDDGYTGDTADTGGNLEYKPKYYAVIAWQRTA